MWGVAVKVLFAFVRAAFHNAYIYRFDFWVVVPAICIMMYASHSIWSILYQQSPQAFGMDLERMTTYGVLGVLLLPMMTSTSRTQYYIAEQVRLGTLELDLMKPLDFMFHMLSRSVGELGVQLTTRILPGLVFAVLFLGFRPPPSLQAGLVFVASLALGYLILFCLSFLMGALAVVTLDIRSYAWAYNSLMRFASGQTVPLWMFPPALVAVLGSLPFQAIYYLPMAIYVGAYEGSFVRALLTQAGWFAGLALLARLFWSRVQRRIAVQGG
jgi:ABC-2 type transport system permease protein